MKKTLPKRSSKEIDLLVKKLMKKMTIKEKVGQLYQTILIDDVISGPNVNDNVTINDLKEGKIGSFLNITDPLKISYLQHIAVNETKNKIPLLFMFDVIHGFKTAFVTPLGMACSFSYDLIYKAAKIMAYEATHSGINVTFGPMLDLVKDARWGRVNESFGEDPYVGSVVAKAFVRGFQGNNLLNKNSLGACAKHFVGYGSCNAGRDYYFNDISDITLHQEYLPSFHSAIKNNVLMVMTSFCALNHIPMTINSKLTDDLLRKKWHFNGLVITDYAAIYELINHKVAKDEKEATKKAIESKIDIDMASGCYLKYLENLALENKKYLKLVNDACYKVLKTKYQMGLFDDPYKNIYSNYQKYFLTNKAINLSYQMALSSIVCLKNDNNFLPILKNSNIAILGHFAKNNRITGPWKGCCDVKDNITIYDAFKNDFDFKIIDLNDDLESASKSDYCIVCLGEEDDESGEAGSKADISFPNDQLEYLKKIYQVNHNIILVVLAGRPLILNECLPYCQSLLFSFYLGNQGSVALKDIIKGKYSPTGKLSISFPRSVGQLPISYISYPTGRPITKETQNERYRSRYLDCDNEPLFKFTYGLSYNKYEYFDFKLSKSVLVNKKDNIEINFKIKNLGKYDSDEIAFLFVESLVHDITRPTNELKYFQRITIKTNETKNVCFKINEKMLRYYNKELENVALDGDYLIKIGSNLDNLTTLKISYRGK